MLQPVGLSLEDVAALRAENQALRSENVQLRSSVELAIGALRQARFTEMADSLRKELKALDAAHRAPELDS
jgi:hypothetical protein